MNIRRTHPEFLPHTDRWTRSSIYSNHPLLKSLKVRRILFNEIVLILSDHAIPTTPEAGNYLYSPSNATLLNQFLQHRKGLVIPPEFVLPPTDQVAQFAIARPLYYALVGFAMVTNQPVLLAALINPSPTKKTWEIYQEKAQELINSNEFAPDQLMKQFKTDLQFMSLVPQLFQEDYNVSTILLILLKHSEMHRQIIREHVTLTRQQQKLALQTKTSTTVNNSTNNTTKAPSTGRIQDPIPFVNNALQFGSLIMLKVISEHAIPLSYREDIAPIAQTTTAKETLERTMIFATLHRTRLKTPRYRYLMLFSPPPGFEFTYEKELHSFLFKLYFDNDPARVQVRLSKKIPLKFLASSSQELADLYREKGIITNQDFKSISALDLYQGLPECVWPSRVGFRPDVLSHLLTSQHINSLIFNNHPYKDEEYSTMINRIIQRQQPWQFEENDTFILKPLLHHLYQHRPNSFPTRIPLQDIITIHQGPFQDYCTRIGYAEKWEEMVQFFLLLPKKQSRIDTRSLLLHAYDFIQYNPLFEIYWSLDDPLIEDFLEDFRISFPDLPLIFYIISYFTPHNAAACITAIKNHPDHTINLLSTLKLEEDYGRLYSQQDSRFCKKPQGYGSASTKKLYDQRTHPNPSTPALTPLQFSCFIPTNPQIAPSPFVDGENKILPPPNSSAVVESLIEMYIQSIIDGTADQIHKLQTYTIRPCCGQTEREPESEFDSLKYHEIMMSNNWRMADSDDEKGNRAGVQNRNINNVNNNANTNLNNNANTNLNNNANNNSDDSDSGFEGYSSGYETSSDDEQVNKTPVQHQPGKVGIFDESSSE